MNIQLFNETKYSLVFDIYFFYQHKLGSPNNVYLRISTHIMNTIKAN